jgi:hypothetical protein
MVANQMNGWDKDSPANPSGLYHPTQNTLLIAAIIFFNKGVHR